MAGVTEAAAWADLVRGVGEARDARYEPIGGLNPAGGPAALCPGRDQPADRPACARVLGRVV